MTSNTLLIFDLDGVVVDSEIYVFRVLSQKLSGLGVQMSVQETIYNFFGEPFKCIKKTIEQDYGMILHDDFFEEVMALSICLMERNIEFVKGALGFLQTYYNVKKCIATSAPQERISLFVNKLQIDNFFYENIFDVSMVSRGKPFPYIFELAAQNMGKEPSHSIVIEDSVPGIKAGVRAGMLVIGLLAGSHLSNSYSDKLKAAGADYVVENYKEMEMLLHDIKAI